MPYGTPTLLPTDQYWIRAYHAPSGMTFFGQIEQDGSSEQSRDAGFQSVVDVFTAAPDWTVVSATKSYAGDSHVTPTP